ncbi:MAG: hypothetical protein KAG19_00695 [Methylococcales bacterium]|nr:hypothetical protein [Methylococcales bacterium]
MNLEKVIFGFFVVLALTLNFGFFLGDYDNPIHHNKYELFAVIVVNLIATALKFGDRSQIGAVLLATSLVADIELIGAAVIWTFADQLPIPGAVGPDVAIMMMDPATMSSIMSLAGGALLANVISTVILVSETLFNRL